MKLTFILMMAFASLFFAAATLGGYTVSAFADGTEQPAVAGN